jgi:hypothetical protein
VGKCKTGACREKHWPARGGNRFFLKGEGGHRPMYNITYTEINLM